MKVFFSGIGGSGMSALAALCLDRGWQVMGSDITWSSILDTLSRRGAQVFASQTGEQIDAPDLFVYTTALPEDHPELVEARKRRLTIKRRPEFLRDLFAEKGIRVAVTGSHGKTTTVAMLGHILREAGRDPAVIAGGVIRQWGVGGRWGNGNLFVAEADESRPTFRLLNPTHLVLCNLDLDHIEEYGNLEHLGQEMTKFGKSLPPEGAIWVGGRDGLLGKLCHTWETEGHYVRTYGVDKEADLRGRILESTVEGTRYCVELGGREIGAFRVNEVGRHIVHNALGAMAMAAELGVPFHESGKALESFGGVSRRWEVVGEHNGATIVSDYAHHPTEIKNLLETARILKRRIVVVFQPHRYTRTRFLGNQLGEELAGADFVILTDVYSAREPESLRINGRGVYEVVAARNRNSVYAETKREVFRFLLETVQTGDLVLFVGAGTIHQWALEFVGGHTDEN